LGGQGLASLGIHRYNGTFNNLHFLILLIDGGLGWDWGGTYDELSTSIHVVGGKVDSLYCYVRDLEGIPRMQFYSRVFI